MKVIELFGCPGSGKTHALTLLRANDVTNNTVKGNYLQEFLKKMIKYIIIFFPYTIRIRKKIYTVVDGKNYYHKFSGKKITHLINNISMLVAIYRYSNKKLILDEGVVHRIISMVIACELGNAKAVEIVNVLKDDIKEVNVLFLDTPIEECYDSIIKRNRHEASIDKLRDDDLRQLLKEYEECCNLVADTFGFEKVNRSKLENIIGREFRL
ncbi:hypothetical protein CIRMBP1320_00917 [Enterococcus cecorum]|nr:hypothetical protein CIRMBP1320_00917 [Enterococcus cecorum]